MPFPTLSIQHFRSWQKSHRTMRFTYEVSSSTGAGGRHYDGECVDGFGNELLLTDEGVKKDKSISRSTVDLALKNVLEEQENHGFISDPRKLGVPGSRSYLFAMFLRFGVITSE